jgi:hypothetical protein
VAESSGYSNELSGSIKGGKCLDRLSDYQLLKMNLLHEASVLTLPRKDLAPVSVLHYEI